MDSASSSSIRIENSTRVAQFYNIKKFEESTFARLKRKHNTHTKKALNKFLDKSFYANFCLKRMPILSWLPKYKLKSFLFADAVAGITIAIMNIPQVRTIWYFDSKIINYFLKHKLWNKGMAYSLLATLPAVNGLYISFFPLIMYSLFGTSSHLATGK